MFVYCKVNAANRHRKQSYTHNQGSTSLKYLLMICPNILKSIVSFANQRASFIIMIFLLQFSWNLD